MNEDVSRRSVLRGLTAGAVLGTSTPSFARYSAYSIEFVKKEVTLERWDADGFRLAFLTDLHLNGQSHTDRAIRGLQMLGEEKPDVLVIGGDILEHSKERYMGYAEQFLKSCSDVSCPVVTVLGNHDYWGEAVDGLVSRIESSRVKLLRNGMFEHQGVTIAGIDDACVRKDRYDFFPAGKVSKSLIGLIHEPDCADRQPAHVSLQVSGHSHGGQICFPDGSHFMTPKLAKKYIAGFFELPVPLYVSRGVGTNGPDMRLFCPPEVTLLTLRSA